MPAARRFACPAYVDVQLTSPLAVQAFAVDEAAVRADCAPAAAAASCTGVTNARRQVTPTKPAEAASDFIGFIGLLIIGQAFLDLLEPLRAYVREISMLGTRGRPPLHRSAVRRG
ncbi:hypothetical protein OTB20_36760 [Streptomyces sp. H27-H1]|uniref:hypothetical protein n=1 Tax=Streptomyces sp. H27-H1 TaxID=2996461 RepID=UPI00226F8833|nr:hypothetical protein [Streptomyces sp. H27-H1]MCY0931638.1 hypothetical protein [Streptomyces sp. H27-H1]